MTRRQCIKDILLSEARRKPPENRTDFDKLADEIFSALPAGLSDEVDRLANTDCADGLSKLASAAWNEYKKFPIIGAQEVSEPKSNSRLRRKNVMVDYGVEGKELWTRDGNLAYTVYFRICNSNRYSHMCVNASTPDEAKVWAEKVLTGELVDCEILHVAEGDSEEVLL